MRRPVGTLFSGALAIGAGLLLVLGDPVLERLRLDAFRERHAELIGLVFLGAAGYALLSGLAFLFGRHLVARRMRRRVEALDPAEQAVLREFALQGRNTIAVPVNDLAVAGLLTEGLLTQVGGHMQPTPKGLVAAVRIDRAFRRQLAPDAVGLTTWTPVEAERRRLLPLRPAFVGEVARWDAIFQL